MYRVYFYQIKRIKTFLYYNQNISKWPMSLWVKLNNYNNSNKKKRDHQPRV